MSVLNEAKNLSKTEIYKIRKSNFCQAQSISYENTEPLLIVRGEGAYLYDENDNQYLDTRNNVCHVGHQNQAVIQAVQAQISELNSNTRYLHPNVCLLSEKLLETFPKELNKVFFVNSGSEANDLALRLAYAHNKRKHKIVIEHGYHGHTQAVIQISPYKFKKTNFIEERCEFTHVADCPDIKFGNHTKVEEYVSQIRKITAENEVGSIFIESGMSVGGVILPPEGYLKEVFEIVRNKHGVCVCDEVQVGFGRFGKHFWAFQQQNVIPDIVTMGKPFGNGMPLAAVVTTEKIASDFAKGPEYFNTFGGNPVSAAAGLAVMDELNKSGLQKNAEITGDYWISELNEIKLEFPELILDVRGSGFFLGLHLIDDRVTSRLVGDLKNSHRILASIDGPKNNVIVFKPPMCFSKDNVDTLCVAIREIISGFDLTEIYKQHFSHCPT